MGLSLFRALNPASKCSGITYSLAGANPCQGTEMIDYTVAENIRKAFNRDLDYFSGLGATYNIMVGNHYDISLNGRDNSEGGEKGVLDYLIFPLIARKIIAEAFLDESKSRDRPSFSPLFLLAIPALFLEFVRFSAGIALTLLLAPIVALVHIIKACLLKDTAEHIPSMHGMTA